ncbi:transcriptional regulator [Tetragenococcus osmophilus]|uniref:Transcriptional regulator n=2 Tax=Tetragenococcus osmophilus TaxID=526944 RepID=A0AA37XJY2_9ENTE|nr:helix-turn-helix domain-containing protein [Tetragenococcus osmophilus]AYW47146.1 transcriptional regulator [Tetragenococcus osmophilus]GMA55233.1 hypothetical protein GCM10025857_65900 [Alicyclobacillus contaminans]GMA71000.1 hypothetical protein GCM10025885_00490 [Tetragenococcus osmophilus]
MRKLYSIGEVAKLNNVSIETLRYYDRIGLFTPASVDPTTHYRYYHEKQFFYLDIIKYLKYIDTPLYQIKEIMKKDVAEMLPFFEEQTEKIDKEIAQLRHAQKILDHRKNQIKEQNMLVKQPRGKVYSRFVEGEEQLHLFTDDLTPYGNPDVYMRDLALLLETKESVVDNFYGCVYELKNYQATEEIIYSSIYTSLLKDTPLPEQPTKKTSKKYMPEGQYICICFKWSEACYLAYYKKLYDYIKQHHISTEGMVFEFSLPNRYFSYEEDDFITELRIKMKEEN